MGIESRHVFLFATFVKGRIHYGVALAHPPLVIKRRGYFRVSFDFFLRIKIRQDDVFSLKFLNGYLKIVVTL